jgi:hypothetical protein
MDGKRRQRAGRRLVERARDARRSAQVALEHVELPKLALAQLEHRTQRAQSRSADVLLEVAKLDEFRAPPRRQAETRRSRAS